MKTLFRLSLCSFWLLFVLHSAVADEWRRYAIQSGDSFYFSDATSGFPDLRVADLSTLQESGETILGGEASLGSGPLLFVHAYNGHAYVGRYYWSQGANQLRFERWSADLSELENVVEAELRDVRTDTFRAFYRRFLLFRKEERLHVIDLYTGATVFSHRLPFRIGARGEGALAVNPASGRLGMIMRFEGDDRLGLNFATYTLRATIDADGKISMVEEDFSPELIARTILPFMNAYSGPRNSAQMVPGTWTMVSEKGYAYDLETHRLAGSLGIGISGIRVLEDGRLIVSRGPASGTRGTVELFSADFNLVGLREVEGRLALPVALQGDDFIILYRPQVPGWNAVSAQPHFQRLPLSVLAGVRLVTPISPLELLPGRENLRRISPDGRFIFEASPETIALFDVAEGKLLMAARLNSYVRSITHAFFHPDDGAFYFGDRGGLLRVHPEGAGAVDWFVNFGGGSGSSQGTIAVTPVKGGILAQTRPSIGGWPVYSLDTGEIQFIFSDETTGIAGVAEAASLYLPKSARLLVRDAERWFVLAPSGGEWVLERTGPPLPPDSGSGSRHFAVIDYNEKLIWDGSGRTFVNVDTLSPATSNLPAEPLWNRMPTDGVSFGLGGDGTLFFRLRQEEELIPHFGRSLFTQILEKVNQAGEVVASRILLDRVSFVPLYPKQVGFWSGTPYIFHWDGNIPRLSLFDDQLQSLPPGSGGLPRDFQYGNWRYSPTERVIYEGRSPWYWTEYTGWHYRWPTGRAESEFWVWFSHRQWGWSDKRFFPLVHKPLRDQWMLVSTTPAGEKPTRFRSLRHGYMFDGHSGFAPTEIAYRNVVLNPGNDEELWEFLGQDYIRVSFTEAGEYVFFWLNFSYTRFDEHYARVTFAYDGMVEDGVLELRFDGLTGGTFEASAVFIENGRCRTFSDSGRFRIN